MSEKHENPHYKFHRFSYKFHRSQMCISSQTSFNYRKIHYIFLQISSFFLQISSVAWNRWNVWFGRFAIFACRNPQSCLFWTNMYREASRCMCSLPKCKTDSTPTVWSRKLGTRDRNWQRFWSENTDMTVIRVRTVQANTIGQGAFVSKCIVHITNSSFRHKYIISQRL